MDVTHSNQMSVQNEGQPGPLRDVLRDAIRYWEPRRVVYNLVLVVVVMVWLLFTWPHFRSALALGSLLFLSVFAMLANVCYCAAYLADVPMQYSLFQAVWRRRRWGLWVTGTLFAILLANYWIADEIYPYVR
ncbi:MAG: hypothetical protein LAN36_00885 [Acidobacteriia bacterium]|nr:hypothetical protein [Terriglobia bacterium]